MCWCWATLPTSLSPKPLRVIAGLRDFAAPSEKLGEAFKFLVGKTGLYGHSNGAEQIAACARIVGLEVIYDGIRSTPAEIVASAKASKAHAVGLSILSGSHLDLVQDVVRLMRAEGLDHVPLVVGGIIAPADENAPKKMGVAKIHTSKDFRLNGVMRERVDLVEARIKPASALKSNPLTLR